MYKNYKILNVRNFISLPIRKICALLSHFISIMQHLESVLGKKICKKGWKRSSKALKRKYQICIILHLNINLTFGFCLFSLMLYVPQTPTSNKEVLLPGIGQKSCPLHCSPTNVRKAKKNPTS